MKSLPNRDHIVHSSKGMLTGLLIGLLCLPGCGQRVTVLSDDPTDTEPDLPLEPDLGADAVVCGEPNDQLVSDEDMQRSTTVMSFLGI